MTHTKFLWMVLTVAAVMFPVALYAHCEVPCGIYGDEARVATMAEHIQTIEKAMAQISKLETETPVNNNQIVRWVMTKEAHAEKIQHIVSQYFMTQRISLDAKGYGKKLGALHQILVYAMKCKQTTDPANVAACRGLLDEFRKLYFKDKEHTHE